MSIHVLPTVPSPTTTHLIDRDTWDMSADCLMTISPCQKSVFILVVGFLCKPTAQPRIKTLNKVAHFEDYQWGSSDLVCVDLQKKQKLRILAMISFEFSNPHLCDISTMDKWCKAKCWFTITWLNSKYRSWVTSLRPTGENWLFLLWFSNHTQTTTRTAK